MWRVGTKVPINVYDGDRPVCQCHNEEDAQRIVAAIADADRLNFLDSSGIQSIAHAFELGRVRAAIDKMRQRASGLHK